MTGDDFGLFFGGWFMWSFWISLVAVIVWAATTIIGKGNNSSADYGEPSLEIMKERNARGEVDQEGFERLKTDSGAMIQIGDNDEIPRSNEAYRYLGG